MPQVVVAAVAVIGSAVSSVAAVASATAFTIGTTAVSFGSLLQVGVSLASLGVSMLSKPKPAQHSPSRVVISANAPTPYCMGETYMGGHLIHKTAFGPTYKKIENPNLAMYFTYSLGPVQEVLGLYTDYALAVGASAGVPPSGNYYNNHMGFISQHGFQPEASHLAIPGFDVPGWGNAHKLSGLAAGLVYMTHDKDQRVYAGGLPSFGVGLRGVQVYDPRQDSTYPGGAGGCRAKNEYTYVYSENPILHGLTYALGRYQNGKHVFGAGIEFEGIDTDSFIAAANVNDLNGWKISGTVYEPTSDGGWNNLKQILQAGGARPGFRNGRLACFYDAPKVSVTTITRDDLADGECVVPAVQSFRDRLNTIIPEFRDPANNWEYVDGTKITAQAYLDADGEEKTDEVQYTLVKSATQAGQLAAYDLVNSRELGPVTIPCKPRMLNYGPGEAVDMDLPELGLSGQYVVIQSTFNPGTAVVDLMLMSESDGKHAFALGATSIPPDPATLLVAEDMGRATSVAQEDTLQNAIRTSWVEGAIIQSADAGSNVTVTVSAHTRHYPDFSTRIDAAIIEGLEYETNYYLYYDDQSREHNQVPDLENGVLGILATTNLQESQHSETNPYRHFLGSIRTVNLGGAATTGNPANPISVWPELPDFTEIQDSVDDLVDTASGNVTNIDNLALNLLRNILRIEEIRENFGEFGRVQGQTVDTLFNQLRMDISVLTSELTRVEQISTTRDGLISGEITELSETVSGIDQAAAQNLNAINSQFGNIHANIISLNQTRASEDQALSNRISAIQASLGESIASLLSQIESLVTADTAQIEARQLLEARLGQNEATLASEIVARSNADGAILNSLEQFRVTTGNNFASFSEDIQLLVEADEVAAVAREGFLLEFADVRALVATETNLRIAADRTSASQLNALRINVDGRIASLSEQLDLVIDATETSVSARDVINARLSNFDAALVTERNARATQYSALSQFDQALRVRLDNVEEGLTVSATSLQSVHTSIRQTEQGLVSLASRVDGLEVNFSDANLGISANARAIEQTESRVTQTESSISSLSRQVNNVSATVGQTQASVTQLSEAIAESDGRASAFYGFRVDAGSNTASVEALAGGDLGSRLTLSADQVQINGNVIVDGTLSTTQLAPGSVSNTRLYYGVAHWMNNNGSYKTIFTQPIQNSGNLIVISYRMFVQVPRASGLELEILRNGTVIERFAMAFFGPFTGVATDFVPAYMPNDATLEIRAKVTAPGVQVTGSRVYGLKVITQELKR